jgi:hypothetical protein
MQIKPHLKLVVIRDKDYAHVSKFRYHILEKSYPPDIINILKIKNKFLSVYNIPSYLEDVLNRIEDKYISGDVRFKWHDADFPQGHKFLQLIHFYPFYDAYTNRGLQEKGFGSFILSKTFKAVYEDALKETTPYTVDDSIYLNRIEQRIFLPMIKRRGFAENRNLASSGTYFCQIGILFRNSEKIVYDRTLKYLAINTSVSP